MGWGLGDDFVSDGCAKVTLFEGLGKRKILLSLIFTKVVLNVGIMSYLCMVKREQTHIWRVNFEYN